MSDWDLTICIGVTLAGCAGIIIAILWGED